MAASNAAVAAEQKAVGEQAKAELIEMKARIRARKAKKAEERREEVAASLAREQAKTKQRLEAERR